MFATENGYEWWTVGEYRDAHPECTGELVTPPATFWPTTTKSRSATASIASADMTVTNCSWTCDAPAPIMDRR